jgi:hypothetical protein
MYAQYAHAVPSHTPYMDDKNFIAALREKDKKKEKEKVKEKGRDKEKEKEKKEDRGRSDSSYEDPRGLYDVSAQNDAREVLLPSFFSHIFSPSLPSLPFPIFPFSQNDTYFDFLLYHYPFHCFCSFEGVRTID